jgi:hypothetical protein
MPWNRWRWIGLVAAALVYLVAVVTFGLGFLLAPASVALSVAAVRRVPHPRGWLPWLGVAANVTLVIPLLLWVVPALLVGGY